MSKMKSGGAKKMQAGGVTKSSINKAVVKATTGKDIYKGVAAGKSLGKKPSFKAGGAKKK
jgi:hypothetical protein